MGEEGAVVQSLALGQLLFQIRGPEAVGCTGCCGVSEAETWAPWYHPFSKLEGRKARMVEAFCATWKLTDSQNFDEYMKALGAQV